MRAERSECRGCADSVHEAVAISGLLPIVPQAVQPSEDEITGQAQPKNTLSYEGSGRIQQRCCGEKAGRKQAEIRSRNEASGLAAAGTILIAPSATPIGPAPAT